MDICGSCYYSGDYFYWKSFYWKKKLIKKRFQRIQESLIYDG
jgi:hypothetical protein